MRVRRCPLLLLALVVVAYTTFRFHTHVSLDRKSPADSVFRFRPSPKSPLVLIWTKCDYIRRTFEDCDSSSTSTENVHQCNVTTDRSLLDEATAIVFCMDWMKLWTDVPPRRYSQQYYVFFTTEPPPMVEKLTHLRLNERRDFFNLSMTYRLDSDVPYVYGRFEKAFQTPSSSDIKNLTSLILGKTRMCAWIASHCRTPSGRERFVRYLNRYVPIDVYGRCGNLSCQRGARDQSEKCERLLERDYKFYLAFENSECRHYVTEKLYKTLGRIRILPIVLDRRIVLDTIEDEETKRVINRSFIAVSDFDFNAKCLGAYLKYLSENTTAYLEYFQWTQTHKVLDDGAKMKPGCRLCSIIGEGKRRVIRDIYGWYTLDAHCQRPRRFSYDWDWVWNK